MARYWHMDDVAAMNRGRANRRRAGRARIGRLLRYLIGCVGTVVILAGPTSAAPAPPAFGNPCVDQIRLWFPPAAQARMIKASWGESHWTQTAHRPRSQYVGCLQIGTRTHARRLARLGITPIHMFDARYNVLVARLLWNESGFSPWAATA